MSYWQKRSKVQGKEFSIQYFSKQKLSGIDPELVKAFDVLPLTAEEFGSAFRSGVGVIRAKISFNK